MDMKIGISECTITPSFPVSLAGFAAERIANEKYDDLFIRVILFRVNGEIYGIINYDLIGIDELIISRLKEKLGAKDLKFSNFIISATHTHSGPGGVINTSSGILKGTDYVMGIPDLKLIDWVVDQTVKTVDNALENMKEGEILIQKDILENIGSNRNNKNFPGNNEITVLFFKQDNGSTATAVNFACHPTVLNMNNTKISADFPGAMNALLKKYGYAFGAYLNGCSGDISTRFTRKGNGYQEVERYGKLLADKVNEMYKSAYKLDINDVEVKTIRVQLKLKAAESVQKAEEDLEKYRLQVEEAKKTSIKKGDLRIIESHYEGALANLNYARNSEGKRFQEAIVSIFKMNNEYFVCVPGELYSQLVNPVMHGNVHFIGYAGYLGYFADSFAYEQNYYEALSSPFEKGQSEVMIEQINKEINKMGEKNHENC